MTREMWDREAAGFDEEADHGLSAPQVREAWRDLLLSVLPPAPACVADLGCGTGSLTRLLTDEGYAVDGLDFSQAMVELARTKVPEARFVLGDAAAPPLPARHYDVVLSRHVLWAMPEPFAAFSAWVELLKPGGVVVLIEGHWSTGAGLTAAQTRAIVSTAREELRVVSLPEEVYWGRAITDERYLAISHR